jgi:hypothetical protein
MDVSAAELATMDDRAIQANLVRLIADGVGELKIIGADQQVRQV